MIPTLHSIPAPTSSPVARIGGGGFSLAPAVTSFGAVAGSSSPRADAKYDADQRLCIRHAPGALTECATSETSAGGFQ